MLYLYSGVVYLNSKWSMFSVDPIRVSLTNRGPGNLTAVALEPLKILCSGESLQMVKRALSNHIHNSRLASEMAQSGIAFPPFYALYKSDEHKEDIVDLFSKMARLGSIESPLYRGRPTFVCICSEADALPYWSTVPDLWDQCQEALPSPPAIAPPVAHYETNTLFICRPFFFLPNDVDGAAPEQCPSVHENQFTDELVHAMFINRATYITAFAINAYSHLCNTGEVRSYINIFNFALRWGADFAVTQPWAYLVFERCRS